MDIINYNDKYKDDIIKLILHIQNQESKINLSLKEQPDLCNITLSYFEKGGSFWVAVDDNNDVVGTIGLMNKGNGYAILKKFFVRSDYRRQKIGLKLYMKLLNFCVDNGYKCIILDTPSVAHASHIFYEKNDFKQISSADLPICYEYPDRNSILYIKTLSK